MLEGGLQAGMGSNKCVYAQRSNLLIAAAARRLPPICRFLYQFETYSIVYDMYVPKSASPFLPPLCCLLRVPLSSLPNRCFFGLFLLKVVFKYTRGALGLTTASLPSPSTFWTCVASSSAPSRREAAVAAASPA